MDVDGLLRDECVRNWQLRLGKGFGNAFSIFRRFWFEAVVPDRFFGEMSPSELVEWQANARGREAFRPRMLAQSWIEANRWRYGTKTTYMTRISSFFLHNYAPFPADPSFRFSSEVPPVVGKLDDEALRRILLNCNKMYRTVFLMMSQGLMGEGELLFVNVELASEVVQHLTKNDGVFRLVLPGRKSTRNRRAFATFLSTKSDWADAFRDYMREAKHDITRVLYVNNWGNPLTYCNIQQYFHDRAVEAGVIKQWTPDCKKCKGETIRFREGSKKRVGYRCVECGFINWASEHEGSFNTHRYGINPHEIRDSMRTRWVSSGADFKVSEFMMGHLKQVDPNEYLKWMEYEKWKPIAEYRKALPWLNVLSGDPSKVDRGEIDARLEARDAEMEVLRNDLVRTKKKIEKLERIGELWKKEIEK